MKEEIPWRPAEPNHPAPAVQRFFEGLRRILKEDEDLMDRLRAEDLSELATVHDNGES